MSAGTVVITGGILAAVILLCIVAVLCCCRLQYYCCRRGDSELDVGSMEGGEPFHGHYACNACSALAMDGTLVPSLSLDRLEELELPQEEEEDEASPRPLPLPAPPGHGGRCPSCSSCSCSSSARPFNGGERLGFHTYYDNPSAPLLLSATASPLSYYGNADLFPAPPRPYSTPV